MISLTVPVNPKSPDLLCESCGYTLSGLPADGACPECGRAIASSAPSARPGSPWQTARTGRSWVRTNYLMLRRPGAVFDRLRVDRKHALPLLMVNLLLAGALLAAPWVGTLIGDPARNSRTAEWVWRIVPMARSQLVGTVGVGLALLGLTAIEALGVRFFGRRRGWRITPDIAWQVCAHASVGWVVAAVLTLLSLIVWLNLSYFGLSGWVARRGTWADLSMALIPAAGFLAGMLVFEVLVYRGILRCKYANPPA
jgi:rRNA maturation protein Nop10